MPKLIEDNPKYWIIEINPHLRTVGELKRFKAGYFKEWGTDGKIFKTRRALYPKTLFKRSQMDKIVRKYEKCPDCIIGRKNLKLKYPKKQYTSMALKDMKHISRPFITLTEMVIPKLRGSTTLTSFWKANVASWLTKIATLPEYLIPEEMWVYVYKTLFGLGLITTGALTHAKGYIGQDLLDELMIMGNGMLFSNPAKSGYGGSFATGDNIRQIQASAERVIGKIGLGNGFSSVGVAAQRIKNAIGLGFGKVKSAFGKIGKGRFWVTPTTHALGLGESTPQFTTKQAGDYGYQNSNWFQDVSNFSPSFIASNRLRTSGSGHEF